MCITLSISNGLTTFHSKASFLEAVVLRCRPNALLYRTKLHNFLTMSSFGHTFTLAGITKTALLLLLLCCLLDTTTGGWWGGRRCSRVNCAWAGWSGWGACNHLCGNAGIQSKSRVISRHASCGGSGCSGSDKKTQTCNRSVKFCNYNGTPQFAKCNCTDPFWSTCCEKREFNADLNVDSVTSTTMYY